MADVVRETERKYEATEGTELPDLAVRGVDLVADEGTVLLDATYYDTADGTLAAQGITLRRRTGGSDEGWHLKLPVKPGTRDEFRAPPAGEPPAALTALVRSRVRDAPLRPVMRLLTERRVSRLRDAGGALLAETAVDAVRAERIPEGTAAAWTEVEVELGEAGRTKLLDRIEKRLARAGLRRASSASKLERALAETTPSTGPGPCPDGERAGPGPDARSAAQTREPGEAATAGDPVLRYVREQVDALVALDPAVRRDLPDSVHRMRVATRRLRSCFRSFATVLDRTVTDPVGEELKWLADELGHDRDREVLTARLSARVGELPRSLRLGPVRGRLRTFTRARRTGSRSRLIAVLDGGRYLALLTRLDALLADPPLRPRAHAPADRVVARAVHRDVDRLSARVGEACAAPPGRDRDLAMHAARKAAKRARYAAEAAQPVFGAPAKRYRRQLTSVQELLGEHQDSVVVREALREIAVQAHAAGEQSFTYGLLHERESACAAACERELPVLWRTTAEELRAAAL